jgi:hemerythrin-like domain-containing protein
MEPIGLLMTEHRLIERMIKLLEKESVSIRQTGEVRIGLIEASIDFIRTYADKTHHMKEEDILFQDLSRKPLAPEHRKTLDELFAEHNEGRKHVGLLIAGKEKYLKNESGVLEEMAANMEFLARFYPAHIDKEENHFFEPAMHYFTKLEQEEMVQKFLEFDRKMIHEKYRTVVESWEQDISA